ncbi:MAG: TRAP transporter small permease [Candidatus Neomarinimicrobiota bacterium]|nr:MAG: TRAP transporter small permease [Candidatus Neomarinimicrobiota bacterium]
MVHKIRITIEKITTAMAVFLMLSLVILAFLQVVLRNFFSIGFSAVEEFMRNGVLWIALVGAVLTTFRGKHISVDILLRYLSSTPKKIVTWIITAFASFMCIIMTWYSILFIKMEIESGSVIGGFCPAWIIEIILPVGFLLLAISFPIKTLDSK